MKDVNAYAKWIISVRWSRLMFRLEAQAYVLWMIICFPVAVLFPSLAPAIVRIYDQAKAGYLVRWQKRREADHVVYLRLCRDIERLKQRENPNPPEEPQAAGRSEPAS